MAGGCLQVSRWVGVSQWGVGDADSWIPGAFPGYGAATMFDQNYQPKPAYNAVVAALGGSSGGGGGGTGSCTATYQETQQWNGVFNGQVTVKATTAISSWTSTVSYHTDQTMTATWNGNPSWPQANVLVMKSDSANGNLAVGQSTTFGFTIKTSDGDYSAPSVSCSTA